MRPLRRVLAPSVAVPQPSRRRRRRWLGSLPAFIAIAGLALLPLVVTSSYSRNLVILVLLFAVVASSWDITLGFGGVFNMAHVAFFGLGAYGSAIAGTQLGLSPWLTLLAGIVTAVVGAVVAFLPAMRMRGIYVALVTFAFSQLVLYVVLSQEQVTGGYLGLSGLEPLEIFGWSLSRNERLGYYYLAAILLVASLIAMRMYVRSRFGLGLMALRDYEEYAVSRGVAVSRHRLGAFVFSAVFAGLVGGVYAHYLGVVSVEIFDFASVTLLLSMILVGGIGSLYGPALGSAIFTIGSELLIDLGVWRFMIMAAIIILTMRFLPDGIWPSMHRAWERVAGGTREREPVAPSLPPTGTAQRGESLAPATTSRRAES
jgi:branched-chain amino acid transport system permease protein